jgi:hypothetical protein
MVRAVDADLVGPEQLAQAAARRDAHPVAHYAIVRAGSVLLGPLDVGRNVLDEPAAEDDAQNLRAPADPQHGESHCEGLLCEPELEVIPGGVHAGQLRMRRLPIAAGMHVPTPGEEQRVEIVGRRRRAVRAKLHDPSALRLQRASVGRSGALIPPPAAWVGGR